MPIFHSPLSRRRVLAGLGASVTAFVLPGRARAQATEADGFRILRARSGTAHLLGPSEKPTAIWGYEGTVPGPTLRLRQGEEFRARLVNELRQPTVIHWHGLRLPNAMDGVPHLTQMPVEPGKSFDYRFTPPDAGTFWYHAHVSSSEQVERGLYGVMIVDEREPVTVDRDIVLAIDDWRLARDGSIHPSFGNLHDAAMIGRIGQYITLNSADTFDVPVKANERVRLRIVNCANARIFKLRFAQHTARIMAVDGQACPPQLAPNSTVRVAPGNRVDLFIDMALDPGAKTPILVDDLRGGELELGRIVYDAGPAVREKPLGEPKALPDNPLPARIDLAGALKIEMPLDGGMHGMMGGGMGGGMMGGGGGFRGQGLPAQSRIWALASVSSSGHDGPPLFSVPRGRAVTINIPNRTMFPHAMHVHGHHFRVLNGSGWKPYWLDTMISEPQATERIAFVADNPGKWMIHCHMLEHQETGMAAWFEVT